MKPTFRKIISFLSLLTLAACVNAQSLVGSYQCKRTDTSNNTVSYPLTIKATGGTYYLQWDDANGFPAMYGTGVMSPSFNNLLSVVFWDAKEDTKYGGELFTIGSDGSLSSSWAYQSAKQMGTEACTKGAAT